MKVDAGSKQWAADLLGDADLGDKRRSRRAVKLLSQLSSHAGESLASSCDGDAAARLGGYRLLENDHIDASAIAQGGFEAVARQAQGEDGVLLAIGDTTTLSYTHRGAKGLGPVGTRPDSWKRGWLAHSVLLVNAQTGAVVGLIDQARWTRDVATHGKSQQSKRRSYRDKESVKWEQGSEASYQRLGAAGERTITVCDRESDVYEYLSSLVGHRRRFVIRACENRRTTAEPTLLFEVLASAPLRGIKTVVTEQRGGRPSRTVQVELRAGQVTLLPPKTRRKAGPPLTVNAIWIQEIDPPADIDEPVCWRLLTSEPVDSEHAVRQVVRYYVLRWSIEEFHKGWKSGAGAEHQRMQERSALERMLVLTALVAVRLLQLRGAFLTLPPIEDTPEPTALLSGGRTVLRQGPCDRALSRDEWRVLYVCTEHKKPPAKPPALDWAYKAIARLGGFTDTKRTGRAGWDTLWKGWRRLQEHVQAHQLSHLLT